MVCNGKKRVLKLIKNGISNIEVFDLLFKQPYFKSIIRETDYTHNKKNRKKLLKKTFIETF